ncbi:hypothetical protein [Streptomyces sp. 4F14]|uniref:hypothetical protein n=1 Tax=Streptomyces sp. 4F14 TaxID=3394380 RepID=UPI003A88A8B2
MTFDIVLADQKLVEEAYRLLTRYEQPTGPAVLFANLRCAAVMVPVGTVHRWNGLMANSLWPERTSRPCCLGRDNMIRVPALQPSSLAARWLVAPDDDQAIDGAPLLTSPPPLARCLAEARSLLEPLARPMARTPLRRAGAVVRSVLPAPQRT